jgi:dCTP deaminase
MILSDRSIKKALKDGEIVMENANEDFIHCASWDVRLADTLLGFDRRRMSKEYGYTLEPGEFVLGATVEKITLGDSLVARVEGRSSLGRMGIAIHCTAGFIDPGFSGTITLEIKNLNNVPVTIYPGQRIGQLCFERMDSPCEVPYGEKKDSKYMNQVEPTASRINQDRENDKI